MRVFHDVADIPKPRAGTSVAIGNFDGVHLGHQELIRRNQESAKKNSLISTVLTFYPHPVEILHPDRKLERLTTISERLSYFEELGVEQVLVVPFTRKLAIQSPEEFFRDTLESGLNAKCIQVGFDFRFGKNRAGDTNLLELLCKQSSIDLHVMNPLTIDGVKVSSSLIRDSVMQGKTLDARKLLGRPYTISGRVIHADGRGRKIGFPTANLLPPAEKCLPKAGVYVTSTVWQRSRYPSVTNIGVRPTFDAGQDNPMSVHIETHLLDFNLPLYDQDLTVHFGERLRDEKKFGSLEELVAQISRDVEATRRSQTFR